ncbi:hypothetical protein ACGFIY_21240 [Micromonospora chersina]
MNTAERLAELRHTNPIMFWVWRWALALFARCGCRDAAALDRIVSRLR